MPAPASPNPWSLRVAVWSTALSGLALVALGVASALSRSARFSFGVGMMLVSYGVLVLLVAAAGHRRMPLASGALIGSALLHLLVLVNSAHGRWAPLLLALTLVPVAVIVGTLMPASRRVLRVFPAPGDD